MNALVEDWWYFMWMLKHIFGLVLGIIPLRKRKLTHTPYCPHAKSMKTCESRFHNNLDPLNKNFDEPEWDLLLPTTYHDIPDGEYLLAMSYSC